MSEQELAGLVSRDAMIGVARAGVREAPDSESRRSVGVEDGLAGLDHHGTEVLHAAEVVHTVHARQFKHRT